MIGREREKEILLPNAVHTRPSQENSEKNSKKIEKIKKPLSDIIFSQNGMRRAEKVKKKNFTSEFRLNPTRARKFRKKFAKKLEKLKKPLSDINFSQNGLR